MRIKKIVGAFMCMLSVYLVAAACRTEELRIYKYPGWDSSEYFEYPEEMYRYERQERDGGTEVLQTRKVQFMGKTYDVTYSETVTKEFFPYADDYYVLGRLILI